MRTPSSHDPGDERASDTREAGVSEKYAWARCPSGRYFTHTSGAVSAGFMLSVSWSHNHGLLITNYIVPIPLPHISSIFFLAVM